MSGTDYSLAYRVSRAAATVVFNIVLWVIVPALIFNQIEHGLPSTPIGVSGEFIYTFGLVITALQAMGALTVGMALSVPFTSGSYIAEAYYIWAAVNGGLMAFSAAGASITLSFQPLLFLLMLAPLFNAVRAPIGYMLDQSEAALPAPETA